MREVDSQNSSETRLSCALRSLAEASPTDAPEEIGKALAGAFRRHHARRRGIRRSVMAVVFFILAVPATILLVKQRANQPGAVRVPPRAVASPLSGTPPPTVAVASPLTARAATARRVRIRSGRTVVPAPVDNDLAAGSDFLDLPSSNQVVRGEDLRVVRLELSGRALRIVGAPVTEEAADKRMLADFIVGQDGTPYAVRLVR